ncbi:MAG: hypothetical protein ABIJ47_01370 [Candidatus Bathyarchaeota archaeon]
MKNSLNRTQMAGLILVGLSLITFIGGGILVSSWLAAVEPKGVNIYVKNAETDQHLPKDIVTVTLTGVSYFGYDYPLDVVLRASKTNPTYWSFSSSLSTLYYVSITATGYVTQTGSVSMPVNFIQEYTYKLSPTPPPPPPGADPEPEPEPIPPEVTQPPPDVKAEVTVNDVKVGIGDTITVDTLDLVFRVVFTEGIGSVQQLYGFVDEESLIFEVRDSPGEYTATYRLPGDGSYDISIRVLDTGGGERPLASFAAVHGSGVAEPNPVDEAVREALNTGTTILSAALASLGAGLYLLGGLKEEKRR